MSIEISIQPVQINDHNTVIEMLKALYIELGEERESVKFLDDSLLKEVLETKQTIVLKAVDDSGKILGILTLTESQAIYAGGTYGVIDEMYVYPQYRSLKVGEKLIDRSVEIAIEKNWNRIDVTAPTDENERTLHFYKKNRFVFTGPKLKFNVQSAIEP